MNNAFERIRSWDKIESRNVARYVVQQQSSSPRPLQQQSAPRRAAAESRRAQQLLLHDLRHRKSMADPVLLDDVYTCPSSSQDGSSSRSGAAAVQASSSSLNSLAALAAYRRQIYLGLDPANPAAAAAAAAQQLSPGASNSSNRPASAASAAPLQAAALAGRRSFALKSRPHGMLSLAWGSDTVPGYLPAAPPAAAAAATPAAAQSGMGSALVPPRLHPRSCCPPPHPEPLAAAAVDAEEGPDVVAARLAEREEWEEGSLLNRLVYDSLQSPAPGSSSRDNRSSGGTSSWASSCRTTTSSANLNVCSAGDTQQANAAVAEEGTADDACGLQQQQGCFEYAPGLSPWLQPEGPGDTTLVFESRFESGNLRRAIQVAEYEYDLVLQPDLNTRGHTQWFFFAVSNVRAGRRYSFNIINLLKEDSLYNLGMLPLMQSEQQMRDKGVGWVRCGHNVCYGANSTVCRKRQTYFNLHFELQFPHDQDLVHLAHCYPFTWTNQQNHIYALKQSPPPGSLLQHTVLAISLAGNAVDLLTITSAPDRGKPMHTRQGVVLSARVHPGETNSSFMMKGALQQLLADTEEAQALRDSFVFKVVPMLNPDGVIVGNYRCSLAGLDLNRVYQAPDARLQPVICAFKDMVRAFTLEREVVLSCDMHGHSRRFGIFMYGCEKKPGKDVSPLGPGLPVPGSLGGLPCVPVRHQERIFPLMLALNTPDLFSYRACNFKVQKSKAGTGRVVGFRELGLVNAFTMEASFAGAAVGKFAKQHFNAGHLEEMGAAVVRTLLDYCAPPELNSAPDLCAQLDAALLQGVAADSSGIAGAAAGSSSCPALDRLGLLAEGGAGEDEDVCTDSDDESSEDEKPAAAPPPAAAAPAAAKPPASSSSASLADLSRQLADMLSGKLDGSKAAGGAKGVASGSSAAAGAVRLLLEALQASEAASSSTALGQAPPAVGASSSAASKAALQQQAPASSGGATAIIISKQPAAASAVKSVTAAAQQLLDKLTAAKAKLAAAAAAAPTAADATACCHDSSSGVAAAARVASGTQPQQPAAAAVPVAAVVLAAATPAAAAATAAAAAAALLSEEEAALLVMPGLQDILQQLVQAAAQHKTKAAADKAKKKSRRKGRWGNPEVLRAARAKADAGLAAALPELGILLDECAAGGADDDDYDGGAASDTAAGCHWADYNGSRSSASTPATPTQAAPEAGLLLRLPFAGRRAQTAGSSKGSSSSSLNVERYMHSFELQKQALGGVLAATSNTDWVADAASISSLSAQQQQQAAGMQQYSGGSSSSPIIGSSKSLSYGSGKKVVAFAVAQHQPPDALQAAAAVVAAAGASPLVAGAAEGGGGSNSCPPPQAGVLLPRRSR